RDRAGALASICPRAPLPGGAQRGRCRLRRRLRQRVARNRRGRRGRHRYRRVDDRARARRVRDAIESALCRGQRDRIAAAGRMPDALYFVVVAAHDEAALPADGAALSLLCDSAEREWRRIEEQAREVLRLDALLKDRDAALDRQTGHIRHLENLVTERDRI